MHEWRAFIVSMMSLCHACTPHMLVSYPTLFLLGLLNAAFCAFCKDLALGEIQYHSLSFSYRQQSLAAACEQDAKTLVTASRHIVKLLRQGTLQPVRCTALLARHCKGASAVGG